MFSLLRIGVFLLGLPGPALCFSRAYLDHDGQSRVRSYYRSGSGREGHVGQTCCFEEAAAYLPDRSICYFRFENCTVAA